MALIAGIPGDAAPGEMFRADGNAPPPADVPLWSF